MNRLLLIMAAAVLCALPVLAGNMLVNGDFETGDLYGWIEAGGDAVPGYETHPPWNGPVGPPPTPAQVFNAAAPMYILEQYDEPTGVRHVRRIALAAEIAPRTGYSVGWTRTGLDGTQYPWISQIFHVAPGRYLVNASWDVMSWAGTGKAAEQAMSGAIYVHVDDRVNDYVLAETALRRTVWNTESKGKWVSKTVTDCPIETRTGVIEVRLMAYNGNEDAIAPPDCEYVAFDNVSFDLTPAPLRQMGGYAK